MLCYKFISFSFLASLQIGFSEGAAGVKKSALEDFTKGVVETLKGKKKRKKRSKSEERKHKKKQKIVKRRKRDSPPIDEETIAQYKEKTSSRRKRKDPTELSEVDKLKQEALNILRDYTSGEFPFNPEFAGDPTPLLATRGDFAVHKENILKDMKLKGKFYKFSQMTLVFDNVSLFLIFFFLPIARFLKLHKKAGSHNL